jgi:beta-ribofuranosylaminobenzene 5'-phosphate synthase
MSDNTPRHTTEPATTIEVCTPGRLHLGMISFGNPAVRSFGGVGVMVEGLGVAVRMKPAAALTASGPLADRAVAFARHCADAWALGDVSCEVNVMAAPPAHVGLGSGTQLALAVAAGMRQLFLADEPVQVEKRFTTEEAFHLAAAVGRGKRSCVGIYGFAGGGLISEAGRFADDPAEPVSPLVARVALPEAWRCVVLIRRRAEGLHGEAEKAAFARLPPVPVEISAELARIAADELMPAAHRGGFAAFSDALYRYGRLAGKPFDPESSRLSFHDAIGSLIELVGECGVRGAAQSSWGPAVMACCESATAAENLVAQLTGRGLAADCDMIVTRFDRHGAVMTGSQATG